MSNDRQFATGRPIQKPKGARVRQTDEKNSVTPGADIEQAEREIVSASGRAGDTAVGRPIQRPKGELKKSDLNHDDLLLGQKLDEDLDEELETPTKLPALFSSSTVLIVLAGLICVLGLFVYSQTLSVLAQLNALPETVRLAGYVGLAVLLLIIVVACLRVFFLFARLRKSRPISIRKVEARSKLGRSEKAYERAQQKLSEYLRSFKLGDEKNIASLRKLGLSAEAEQRLLDAEARLNEERPVSAGAWIDDFDASFLRELDMLAKMRVIHYAKLVALKTAISPSGLLDTAIVLYNNFRIFSDLLVIYRVRTDWIGTAYVLMWVVGHAYVSGEMGENIGQLSDGISEELSTVLGEGLTSKLFGKAAARGAEASANFLFTRRIGLKGIKLLRPISA